MAVICCNRCDRYIDLDYNVDDVVWIDNRAVCVDCLDDEEIDHVDNGEVEWSTKKEVES